MRVYKITIIREGQDPNTALAMEGCTGVSVHPTNRRFLFVNAEGAHIEILLGNRDFVEFEWVEVPDEPKSVDAKG